MSRLAEFGERKLGVPRPDVDVAAQDIAYQNRRQWYLDVAEVTVTDLVSKGLESLASRGVAADGPVVITQDQIIEPREEV